MSFRAQLQWQHVGQSSEKVLKLLWNSSVLCTWKIHWYHTYCVPLKLMRAPPLPADGIHGSPWCYFIVLEDRKLDNRTLVAHCWQCCFPQGSRQCAGWKVRRAGVGTSFWATWVLNLSGPWFHHLQTTKLCVLVTAQGLRRIKTRCCSVY